MQNYLLVGLGGALGAMSRYGLGGIIGRLWQTSFPLAILIINVLGALAMGITVGLLARFLPPWQEEARLLVAVGILGGFTTFSSFSLDTVILIERGELAQALLYVGLSVVICVAGLYLGLLITRGGTA